MRVDLEAEQARQRERVRNLLGRDATAIRPQHVLVQALHTHLYLRASQPADERQPAGRHGVRARLDDQPHHAVRSRLVRLLLRLQLRRRYGLACGGLLPGGVHSVELRHGLVVRQAPGFHVDLHGRRLRGALVRIVRHAVPLVPCAPALCAAGGSGRARLVQRAEELGGEPKLVVGGVVAPGAAQHDDLYLVRDVPHLHQRAQAACHLQVRVEPVALRALAGGFVGQVALRHAHVGGAVQAVAGAAPRLRDHGDGGHAGRCAPRFHANGGHELPLQQRRDVPAFPAGRVVVLHVQVVREDALLREAARAAVRAAVRVIQDAVELLGLDVSLRSQHGEYFKHYAFHNMRHYTGAARRAGRVYWAPWI